MAHLIYPTVDLFLYDLRRGLGQEDEDINKNRQHFAQKLPASIRPSVFENDTKFEGECIELLGEDRTLDTTFTSSDYEGYYYPASLGDTYGLLLDCSVKNKTNPYPTSCISNIKAKIDERFKNQVTVLGLTWMISGELPSYLGANINPVSIAQECYQALIPNAKWQENFQGQGYFKGATIFELWRYNNVNSEKNELTTIDIQDNHHVIIVIYSNKVVADKAADLIADWMRLFSYRHKIIWSYQKSRIVKKDLQDNFVQIRRFAEKVEIEKFKELRQNVVNAQKILPKYTINLGDISALLRNIEVNSLNYNKRLIAIKECISEIQNEAEQRTLNKVLSNVLISLLQAATANSSVTDQSALLAQLAKWQDSYDIKFLEKFSDEVAKKYQLQIQKDYENLSPGLQLLQDLINASRAITEIDQAERDRTFQYWAGILGVGLASAALGLSVAIDKLDKNGNDPARSLLNKWVLPSKSLQEPQPWWFEPAIPLIYGVSVGVSVGVIFAALNWLCTSLRQRSR